MSIVGQEVSFLESIRNQVKDLNEPVAVNAFEHSPAVAANRKSLE